MHKLDAPQLAALGQPVKSGAQQIEDWLRSLLSGGTLRLDSGLVELRGSQPVVTTLGDLKRACGAAIDVGSSVLSPSDTASSIRSFASREEEGSRCTRTA